MLNSIIAFADPASGLSLDDSVALALKNNPTVNMAIDDQQRADGAVAEAEAGKGPSLSLGTGVNRAQGSTQSLPGTSYNSSIKLNWTLYSGGRLEGLVDQAKLNAEISDLGVDKAREQVKLDATSAYYGVLQASDMVGVNKEAVESLTQHLKTVKAQFDSGVIAKSDLLRSEVELANAQQNLTKAQNAFEIAKSNLNNVIGAPLDTEQILNNQLSYTEFNSLIDDCISYAMNNRPEIQQSKNSMAVAEKGVQIAESGNRPTVTTGVTDGWSGDEFPGQTNNWSMNVMANWNVFDSGLTNARVNQNKAASAKAKDQDTQLRGNIELEVRQNYMSMREAEKRLQTTQVAADKAAEDLKIAKTKYYAGVGTNLDVIDAQLALTQAKTNHTQALYDYNVNMAKLEKSMGIKV
ncbi:TolC family protein [Sporomusa sp.]|uniref:TolC family protein n=1 Tax=Sporomusa sp. TaxID=2078658 RepID=UPI002CA5DFDD|nr:TolC family protein [Sporomusa sp.]HWR44547.1 TolC family protein [Sporomusa sp.]